jgi:hypothetical protein
MKILGFLLIIGGALSLAYNRVNFSADRHKTEVGPVDISVQQNEHLVIPQWAGFAAIGAGVLLLLAPQRKT